MQLSTGQYIGQYRIVNKLGAGGMAEIFRAHQENMGRDVAIKVLKADLDEAPEATERFRREARTIASLSHPHIIKVFDYDRYKDIFYLVMELLEGGTLADRIRRGPLPLDTINTILSQVAQALDYIHNNGIVHRDLKPSNILFDRNGYAILTDFGISKRMNTIAALTAAGMAMGTLVYMAPEQLQGEPSDKRADVYALGVVLFEMLTGKLPFDGTEPYAVFQSKLSGQVPSVQQLRPDAPAGIQEIVEKALAQNPDERFQSTTDLASAFDSALKSKPFSPARPTAKSPAARMETLPELPSPFPAQGAGDRTLPEMASPFAVPGSAAPVGGDKTLPELPSPFPAQGAGDRTLPETPSPFYGGQPSSPSPRPDLLSGPISAPTRRGQWRVTREIGEPRKRSPLPLLLAGVVIILLLGGGAAFVLLKNPTPTPTPTSQPTAVAAAPTQEATTSAPPSTTPSATSAPTLPTATATTEAGPGPFEPVLSTGAPTSAATLPVFGDNGKSDVPTEFVPLLHYALEQSPSLKYDHFSCKTYVQVMSNLKTIAGSAGDEKQAADAKDLVQNADAKQLLKYCSSENTPPVEHQLPQDEVIAWGNVRLLLTAALAKYEPQPGYR